MVVSDSGLARMMGLIGLRALMRLGLRWRWRLSLLLKIKLYQAISGKALGN